MKKLLLALPFFLFVEVSGAEIQPHLTLEETAQRVSPCRYWGNTTSGGSVCSSYAFSMNVPEARDVDREIQRLEDRIRRLEEKITGLANK